MDKYGCALQVNWARGRVHAECSHGLAQILLACMLSAATDWHGFQLQIIGCCQVSNIACIQYVSHGHVVMAWHSAR